MRGPHNAQNARSSACDFSACSPQQSRTKRTFFLAEPEEEVESRRGLGKEPGWKFPGCQAQAEAQVTTEARDLGHYRSLFSGFVSPHLLPIWS